MEVLVLWLFTIIASFGMEIANELRLYKDVADAGYKIDGERLSKFNEQLFSNETKIERLSILVLGINILMELKKTIQFNNVKPVILDQLRVIDVLEEMTKIEKIEYLKNPTGLNALIVLLKSEISKATSIKIKDGNEYSEIYYEMGESVDDITILKVSGPASKLTVEEQKKKVVEAFPIVVEAEIKNYGDIETLTDTLKSNTSIELSDSKEDKKDEETTSPTPQKLNISEQKQTLESLKSELLEEREVVQSTQTDKGLTLSKRRK